MFTSSIDKDLRNKLMLCALAVVGAAIIGSFGSAFRLSILAAVVVFFIAMNIAFLRGTEGLYLVIFATLFSPEIASGITTGRLTGEGGTGLILRLEDVVMTAVVLGWMLRSAYIGERFGIIKTPVNSAIWIYMGASVIATLLGLLGGSVQTLSAGILHNLKYFEYFLLYFMILAHVRRKEIIVRMIYAMLIVFFLALIYGYTQMGSGERICAPFDSEPNTFGGYIVLMMCLAGGIALVDNRGIIRPAMIFLIIFAVPPLLFTLSRSSYFAVILGFVSFLVVSRHRILIAAMAIALVATIMLGSPMLPKVVQQRVAGTFQEETEFHVRVAGIDLDASSSARVISYQQAVNKWIHRPLFGYGVTGTHFIDGQYPRLLVETGIVGLSAFLLIFWRLLGQVRDILRKTTEPLLKGASMGFLCGIIAMLAHAVSANSFIIIRIAEPFWLLAGLILVIPHIEADESRSTISYTQPAPS